MRWDDVDDYLDKQLGNEPEWLADVRAANSAAGLPEIAVSVQLGALLGLLVRLIGAQRILEVGTLGGYSALRMADAAGKGSEVVTLERNAENAAQARRNFENARLADRIRLIEGDARETLAALEGPFDLAFIDADKRSNRHYLAEAMRLCRPGALIVVDNIVRGGNVIDAAKTDPDSKGIREAIAAAGAEGRLIPAGIQTVGSKGWDGLLIAILKD